MATARDRHAHAKSALLAKAKRAIKRHYKRIIIGHKAQKEQKPSKDALFVPEIPFANRVKIARVPD
jgi:hypothetical protein